MEPSSAHIEKSIHFEWDQKPGRPPGTQAVAIPVPPFTRVGMLICADAYTSEIARNLQAQGAQLLVSAAAWAPGHHGPNGEWERCTSDTGLPLIVCNRTGPDRTLDFTKAETVVVKDGRRLLSLSSKRSTVFAIEWDLERQTLATMEYRTIYLYQDAQIIRPL